MAHQSLYRKYRPSTFDDVVGQQHIERTLRNAVGEGRVAHAYLFTGPRGTGKTTTARLLAKALLCERGPTTDPDGTCEQCIEIAEGRHPDVREIDAASNTGVDNIREEIIGRVNYATTRGGHKVYIIDEVHMLSTAAFNAFLKTLEEPPKGVVFILCTTHPQKVPETIHSRCQRFDFHRLSVEDIAGHLRYIAESEGFRVDKGAFTLIAKHAGGGMRDAITALEQLAAFTGGEITVDDVEGLHGQVDSAQLFTIAALIARRDIAGCFRWVADTVETGADLSELVSELTAHVRDLYVVAAVGDARGIVDRTSDEMALLKAQAIEFTGPDRLARVLDLLGELASEMRWSSDPRLSLEVALTRMARPQGEMTLEALAERVELLERFRPAGGVAAGTSEAGARGVATGGAGDDAPRGASAAPAATPPDPNTSQPSVADVSVSAPAASDAPADTADEPCDEPVISAVRVSGELDRAKAKRNWPAVLQELKKLSKTRSGMFAQVEVDVDVDGKTLVIEFAEGQQYALSMAEEQDVRDMLKVALSAVFDAVPPFRYQLGRGAVRPAIEPPATPEPVRVDVAPDSEPADPAEAEAVEKVSQATGFTEPSTQHAVASSDLEHVLLNQLGAQIVDEVAHQPETDEEGPT